jgi:hypothetical protein
MFVLAEIHDGKYVSDGARLQGLEILKSLIGEFCQVSHISVMVVKALDSSKLYRYSTS